MGCLLNKNLQLNIVLMFLVVTVNVCEYIHFCFSPASNSEQ